MTINSTSTAVLDAFFHDTHDNIPEEVESWLLLEMGPLGACGCALWSSRLRLYVNVFERREEEIKASVTGVRHS